MTSDFSEFDALIHAEYPTGDLVALAAKCGMNRDQLYSRAKWIGAKRNKTAVKKTRIAALKHGSRETPVSKKVKELLENKEHLLRAAAVFNATNFEHLAYLTGKVVEEIVAKQTYKKISALTLVEGE